MNWQDNLNKSNQAFLSLVWPVIKSQCGDGIIKPVEVITDNDLAHDLDVMCGIDIWQTISGRGCFGIASRVQFADKNWGTFTIRRTTRAGGRTEYDKRAEAIASGGKYLLPYLTSHAYVSADGQSLIGGGVARTVDIFDAINETTLVRSVFVGGVFDADFYVIPFDKVQRVFVFYGEDRQKAEISK